MELCSVVRGYSAEHKGHSTRTTSLSCHTQCEKIPLFLLSSNNIPRNINENKTKKKQNRSKDERINVDRTFSVAVFKCIAVAGLFLVALIITSVKREKRHRQIKQEKQFQD